MGKNGYLRFNLNNYVYVRLTPSGEKILAKSGISSKKDGDGYSRFQAWEFMEIFGSAFHLGAEQPSDLDVLFRSDDIVAA